MRRNLAELTRDRFDVVVIGGGITGAWIALDCVTRGMRTALLEQGDFGSGTSAKSSKLLHGGIRYLQQLRLDKVRESARERGCYQRFAPHLSHLIPFVVPTYDTFSKSKFLLSMGMAMYRLVCLGHGGSINAAAGGATGVYRMNRGRLLQKVPLAEEGLTGAVVFPESHMHSSERMTLAIIREAARRGAICVNYVRASAFIRAAKGAVEGVAAVDSDTGEHLELRARVTVNAAGPWIPGLNQTALGADGGVRATGFSQGSHLVTRQLIADYAIAIPTQYAGDTIIDRGGRHIFILPWRGCSLIGTSYAPARGDLGSPEISRLEVDQLIREVNRQMPRLELKYEDVRHAFTGIYPLQATTVRDQVYQGTGEYQILDHATGGAPGLISALGAKYTTARLLAEKTANRVHRVLGGGFAPCVTRQLCMADEISRDLQHYVQARTRRYADLLPDDQIRRLVHQYGPGIDDVMARIRAHPHQGEPISAHRDNLKVEVLHAVESEMALHLDDVLYRRTGIGTIGYPDADCIEYCLSSMADLLHWGAEDRERERQRVRRYRFDMDTLE